MSWRVVAIAAVLTGAVAQTVNAQESIFRQLVGVWNHIETGHSIDVRWTGDVWTTGGSLARSASTIQEGANFAFEGTSYDGRGWRCAYYITFLKGHQQANWRLVRGRGPIDCPRGIFHRVSREQG